MDATLLLKATVLLAAALVAARALRDAAAATRHRLWSVASAAMFASLVGVRRLVAASGTITDRTWHELLDGLGGRLGLRRRPRLAVSAGVSTPMAGGVWRPTIFLPITAPGWDAERRTVVLA